MTEDGLVDLSALTYKGNEATTNSAQLVVIGGTGSYEDGRVTLSKDAEGFFFRMTCTTSSGTRYSVVTPVILASELPESLPEETTEATVDETTAPDDGTTGVSTSWQPDEPETGCGSTLALPVVALLLLAGAYIAKKKEN